MILGNRDTRMKFNSLEEMMQQSLRDPIVLSAAIENDIRSVLGSEIHKAMEEKNIGIRNLAKMMGVSRSQVRRLLYLEIGGDLMLSTIVRAIVVLGPKTNSFAQITQSYCIMSIAASELDVDLKI